MNITRTAAIGAIGALGAVTVAATLSAQSGADAARAERAEATLVDASGTVVGSARFTEDGRGRFHVIVRVRGLTPDSTASTSTAAASAHRRSTRPAATTTR